MRGLLLLIPFLVCAAASAGDPGVTHVIDGGTYVCLEPAVAGELVSVWSKYPQLDLTLKACQKKSSDAELQLQQALDQARVATDGAKAAKDRISYLEGREASLSVENREMSDRWSTLSVVLFTAGGVVVGAGIGVLIGIFAVPK